MTVTPDSVASVAARCLRTTGVIDPDTPLALLGLDSLSTIEMAADLEEAFGCELPADLLTECTDARALASVISVLRATKRDAAREDPFDAMLADSVLPDDVKPLRRAGISTDLRSARRILLTGATGFLGGALLDELLGSTGADIVCLLRNRPGWRRQTVFTAPGFERSRVTCHASGLASARYISTNSQGRSMQLCTAARR